MLLIGLLLAGCSGRDAPAYVAPKEAALAISMATHYAESNGLGATTVERARLSDGVWLITLRCNGGQFAVAQVAADGKIVTFSGPR